MTRWQVGLLTPEMRAKLRGIRNTPLTTHRIDRGDSEGWTDDARARAAKGARKGRKDAARNAQEGAGAILGPKTPQAVSGGRK